MYLAGRCYVGIMGAEGRVVGRRGGVGWKRSVWSMSSIHCSNLYFCFFCHLFLNFNFVFFLLFLLFCLLSLPVPVLPGPSCCITDPRHHTLDLVLWLARLAWGRAADRW